MQISKNVPMPALAGRRGESRHTLEKMTIGDSVFVEREAANRFSTAARFLDVKITRKAEDGGFRFWRIS